MKFDMHCHSKEGSIDAKVSIESLIGQLIEKGFDGMLLTDHNSYKGYQKWERIAQTLEMPKPFTVLKGIEYDTRDAGHIIAILPDHVHCRLLEFRGLTFMQLEKLVHHLGGILGPAHPYGNGFFAFMNTTFGRKNNTAVQKFDFIETFNACSHARSNARAKALADQYQKPEFAGSDAHKTTVVGTASTTFDKAIETNNDLIKIVLSQTKTLVSGSLLERYQRTGFTKKYLGIIGYFIYNKLGALLYTPARRKAYRVIPDSDAEL